MLEITEPSIKYNPQPFSLWQILLRFKWRTCFTLMLVFIESIVDLLYPLFIGWAINGLLDGNNRGLLLLLGLGLTSVIIGSARRFFDTRIYAGIYEKITLEMVIREKSRNTGVSKISARTNLLNEFVEFLENVMPEVIKTLIGLFGVLIIIGNLNTDVFIACLGVLIIIGLVYLLAGHLNYRFNAGFNEELEQQVRVIAQGDNEAMAKHLKQLMCWNIKLSDLETGNYFIIWLAVVALFVFTPLSAANSEVVNYGLLFALLMYVFEYIEKVTTLPLFIQQLIRLKEISTRMA